VRLKLSPRYVQNCLDGFFDVDSHIEFLSVPKSDKALYLFFVRMNTCFIKLIINLPAKEVNIMNKNLIGLHHITAITSSAPKIFNFMIEILGLHLIKKTVNQDDIRTYHLYFTDDMVKAGTDITFFDFL
jgi:hypothetical protein